MATIQNEDCGLIESEARRILPDGFQVKCVQHDLSEDFFITLITGGRPRRLRMGINTYEGRDWRAALRRTIYRELKSR